MIDSALIVSEEAARLERASRRTLPWLALAALMVVGGLYYSGQRLVHLDREIAEKQARLAQLNEDIEKARRQLEQGRAAAAGQTLSAAVERGVPPAGNPPSVTPAPSQALADLTTQFNGPERRRVSELIAMRFEISPDPAVLSALAQAALPESDVRAYRVNLYILVTLARMPQWVNLASAEQTAIFRGLASSAALREDATYRGWADRVMAQLNGRRQP